MLNELLGAVRGIFQHRHKWTDTRVNPWFIATEQHCKCGAYRHHTFDDVVLGEEPKWRDGRHPDAPNETK